MNFDYYHVFLTVGKRLSFTAAAKDLFTSQPAVTRTIQKLEGELGCRLFTRNKKGVAFTPEGQILYNYVSAAFVQLTKGEEEVSSRISLEGGTLAIGSTVTALDEFLFAFLDEFHSLYPNVHYRISSQSSDGTITKLRSGLLDLAFVTTPFTMFDDLLTTTISDFPNVLIAGEGIEEFKKGVHTLQEAAAYPIVSLSSSMQLRQYVDELFQSYGLAVTPSMEVDSANMIIPMVRHNLGLGIVPYSLAKRSIEKGDVYVVELKEKLPSRSVVMALAKGYPPTIASKRFYELALAKALKKK